jgi:hypothetical protein
MLEAPMGARLKMKIFFLDNMGYKNIEGQRHWIHVNKYIGDVVSISIENISYVVYFLN